MLTSTLRSVGGSIMMAIPKPVLESLGLAANEKVALRIEDGHLIVEAHRRPKYTLTELLAQCDANAPLAVDIRDWDEAEAIGREVI
jgi:antitoxin ChpS